jgi:hypothetical protein
VDNVPVDWKNWLGSFIQVLHDSFREVFVICGSKTPEWMGLSGKPNMHANFDFASDFAVDCFLQHGILASRDSQWWSTLMNCRADAWHLLNVKQLWEPMVEHVLQVATLARLWKSATQLGPFEVNTRDFERL